MAQCPRCSRRLFYTGGWDTLDGDNLSHWPQYGCHTVPESCVLVQPYTFAHTQPNPLTYPQPYSIPNTVTYPCPHVGTQSNVPSCAHT